MRSGVEPAKQLRQHGIAVVERARPESRTTAMPVEDLTRK
jgi:hypothetical protein